MDRGYVYVTSEFVLSNQRPPPHVQLDTFVQWHLVFKKDVLQPSTIGATLAVLVDLDSLALI